MERISIITFIPTVENSTHHVDLSNIRRTILWTGEYKKQDG
jgi:hypothetical protein